MSINEIFQLASYFYPNWDLEYALELLNIFNLDLKMKVKTLSKGMESALGVTVGLASRASITIFDEPYIGMDAVARQMFYDLLVQEYMENPRTIILSTHLIDEVSKLFEEVIIIDQGKVLLQKEVDELRVEAFYVNGETAAVTSFIRDKKVIYQKTFGLTNTVGIYGYLSEAEKLEAKDKGLTLENMPLQKLMIHMTSITGKGESTYESN